MLGVRNRFLLQMNNWSNGLGLKPFLAGLLFRNAVVIAGVLFQERGSLRGILQAWQLRKRARGLRAAINAQIADRAAADVRVAAWFSDEILESA
jgi:hypothetical protein